MATLNLTGGEGYFSWYVSGLGKDENGNELYWGTKNYDSMGITRTSFTSGSDTRPSNTISTVTPKLVTGTSKSTDVVKVEYAAGTYTFYAWAKTSGSTKYWSAGSGSVTVKEVPKQKPDPWSWDNIIYAGAPLSNLTAGVWKNFTNKINEIRVYKGNSEYSFTSPRSGATEISTCVREAVSAISGLTGHGTLPSTITNQASTWVQLASALNAALK